MRKASLLVILFALGVIFGSPGQNDFLAGHDVAAGVADAGADSETDPLPELPEARYEKPFPDAERPDRPRAPVHLVEVSGVISPASAGFVVGAIEAAQAEGAECIVIQLDTPGGLMESMRSIVKAILSSDVPVVTYVAPSGSRAASAGVFIALASHIVAMAPGTNIGAAHPVGLGGEKQTEEINEKVLNDAAAYIKSLAKKHGRNEKWAEDAVRKSVSVTETEAVELNVADYVCASVFELLDKIDGSEVELVTGTRTLNTKGSQVEMRKMNLRYRILNTISDPNIAYILLILGIYGIFFELSNPGAIFPGVIGGIFILLSLYALQTLPVNYAGLLLILFGIVLFIAEIKVTSYGLLAVGGVVSMTLGSIMLIESSGPFLRISWQVILVAVLSTAAFFTFAVAKALLAQKRKPTTGFKGLIGEIGTVTRKLNGGWKVFIHSEFWDASSTGPLEVGDKVRVTGIDGFKLVVEKLRDSS
ncbi:MAG: nodulation protein NfeD [Candidatus Eiseniibacteriota bacterium]|nr:MAG: nodulation protein NfeD [Candidatus Eisenbacteria bacterium]